MKRKQIVPLMLVALLLLLTVTACGSSRGKKNTSDGNGQQPNVIIITATPQAPVVTEPPAPLPTEAPVVATELPLVEITEPPVAGDEPLDYFVEEFDQGLGNWSYFMVGSTAEKEKQADVFTDGGLLNIKLTGYNIYYYLLYDPFTYGDVRLDVEVQNGGVSTNSVSLVCRYDDDLGWYEFNVSSNGQWEILYYDNVLYKGYKLIADGASLKVNTGRDTNIYTAVCQGRNLSLYINDNFVKTVEHKDLSRGLVGLGINSFDAYPVIMKVPWFEISQP